MTARLPDLDLIDERLQEWGYLFRDRKFRERCRSIESRFRATSEDFSAEGWGDMDSAPRTRSARSYSILRAIEIQEAVQALDPIYSWALTYGYAYPYLPKFVVLRCMKKFVGRRLNWAAYLDALDLARMRVHATVFSNNQLTA